MCCALCCAPLVFPIICLRRVLLQARYGARGLTSSLPHALAHSLTRSLPHRRPLRPFSQALLSFREQIHLAFLALLERADSGSRAEGVLQDTRPGSVRDQLRLLLQTDVPLEQFMAEEKQKRARVRSAAFPLGVPSSRSDLPDPGGKCVINISERGCTCKCCHTLLPPGTMKVAIPVTVRVGASGAKKEIPTWSSLCFGCAVRDEEKAVRDEENALKPVPGKWRRATVRVGSGVVKPLLEFPHLICAIENAVRAHGDAGNGAHRSLRYRALARAAAVLEDAEVDGDDEDGEVDSDDGCAGGSAADQLDEEAVNHAISGDAPATPLAASASPRSGDSPQDPFVVDDDSD
jgi:hypothetical protein